MVEGEGGAGGFEEAFEAGFVVFLEDGAREEETGLGGDVADDHDEFRAGLGRADGGSVTWA